MKVARENAVVGVLDGRIYVMGGCSADESMNWAEVFDLETETWESLPYPDYELCLSLITAMVVRNGKIYVRTSIKTNDYVYDPKEGRWDIAALVVEGACEIDNVCYAYCKIGCLWYDTKSKKWRMIKGLEVSSRNCHGCIIALANYGGKVLILWDEFTQPDDHSQSKNIWCSVIAVEKRNGDEEVWGNVEWASVVLTVPSSYVFLRCEMELV